MLTEDTVAQTHALAYNALAGTWIKDESKMRLFVTALLCLWSVILVACSLGDDGESRVDYVAKLNQLARQGRDESLNAAPFYKKAAELYVKRPEGLGNEDLFEWSSELTKEKQSQLKQWAESNQDAFAQLKLGTKKPYYWNQYEGDNIWKVLGSANAPELREIVRATLYRVKCSAMDMGITKKTAEDVLTCCQFGSHLRQVPDWTVQLIGMAVVIDAVHTLFSCLARTDFDPAVMDLLQRRIQADFSESQSHIASMLDAEKLKQLEAVQMLFQGPQDDSKLKPDEAMGFAAHFGDLTYEQLQAVRRGKTVSDIDAALAYCKEFLAASPWEARQKGLSFWEDLQKQAGGNPVVIFCMFDVPRYAGLRVYCRAWGDALVTTLAVFRYKHDRGGMPRDLGQLLAAGYLSQLPMDPYSDGPLVYKKTGDDFMLYSLNKDFDDDGGKHSEWGQDGDYVFWPVQRWKNLRIREN